MSHSILKDKKRTRPTKDLLKVLWSYIRGFKKQLVLISVVILLYTLAATAQPIIIQLAIDAVLTDINSNFIPFLITLFISLSILVWVFQSFNVWLISSISSKLVQNLRNDTFTSLVNADMAYHHKNQSGNITARVVSDTQEITTGLTIFTNVSAQILLVLSTLILLAYINVIFVIIALLGVPLAILLSKFFGKIGRKRSLSARQAYGKVSGKLAENLSGIGISKSFKQEKRVSAEFSKLNQSAFDHIKKLIVVTVLIFPTVSLISTLLVYAVLLSGGYLSSINTLSLTIPLIGVINFPTGSQMSIDIIFLGTILIQRFLTPITQLSQNYTQLQSSLGSLDRITDVLEFQNTVKESPTAKALEINGGLIKFDNVSFSYDEGVQVLNNISFDILAGEKVALVGYTGAGKSTIANLLMRFYDPEYGHIEIENQKLTALKRNTIYANIGLVTQDPYIFADTIIENMRYGDPTASDDDIYEVCKLIGAHDFIEIMPDGYHTLLNESGKSLSAGQRQMITIARVFISQPQIVILDEATSRLDAYTESLVQQAQLKLFEGRTTLIIAHRLSTIQDVNRIIVLDNGTIEGIGNHEELITTCKKYQELYDLYYSHQGIEIFTENKT